ncbi:MAG: hypothetical protein GX643_15610 [Acidimicrobiales bacterium]|nr:hypothetical protein [Acidimicrobiales bacterium]
MFGSDLVSDSIALPPPSDQPPRTSGENGQVVPVMAVALLLAAVLGLGLVRVAGAAAQRAAAQAAADAAALAGAEDGRPGAVAAAEANGAVLVSYLHDHLDVEVEVTRRGHRAAARARWLPQNTEP